MPLPSAEEVVNEFLYGSSSTPSNLSTSVLPYRTSDRTIDIDTAAYFDPLTGPGRFALASKSALVEAFFSNEFADIFNAIAIANSTLPSSESWDQVDGSYHLSKADLAAVLGIDWYGIDVANRSVADGYDDYAERTFIWGGTQAKLSDSEDLVFVVDPYSGERYIENLAIVPLGNENFDFDGSDFVTNSGNFVLRHAVDPSGIGARVDLKFEEGYDPAGVTYTLANYQADLDKEASWSQPLIGDLLAAIQVVVDDLWANGVTRFLHGDKPIIYGTETDDVIASSYTILDYDIAASSTDFGLLELKMHEFVGNGIIYQGGSGNDYVTGTSGEDVAYGGDENDFLDGGAENDVVIGNAGADSLFGGGADDFIFFDFADGANVYGGAGRDVAVALEQDGVTVDMAAQGLECVIGCDGADTITIGEANSGLFAAGGDGSDTFLVTNGDGWIEGGPRVLWGGSGADTFDFERASYAYGIAVVQIDGLTEEMFAGLTLADLGLGSLDLSLFQAVILNPDQDDRFLLDGQTFSSEMHIESEGRSASVRSHDSAFLTEVLGRSLSVQGLYEDNYVEEAKPNFEFDDMENIISISRFTGTWDADGNDIFDVTEYDPFDNDAQAEAEDLYHYYRTHTDQVVVQVDSGPQYNAFWSSLWLSGVRFLAKCSPRTGSSPLVHLGILARPLLTG